MARLKFVFAAVLALAVAGAALARTEPNSFLNKPAPNLQTLISHVKSDKVVMSRFTRHFGMTEDQVIELLSGLKLDRLKSDGVYLIYNVPGSEEVRSRAIFYRKGTLVWSDQTGQPVLKVSCGNPMVRGSDIGVATVSPSVVPSNPKIHAVDDTVLPEASFVEAQTSIMDPGPMGLSAQNLLPESPVVPEVSGQSLVTPWIIPATAGLLFGINRDSAPPVPEPCSMVVLGFGAAAIAARRRKR